MLAAAPAAAGDALDRILAATAAASGVALPSRGALIAACDRDLACSARRLVEVLGAAARLLPVVHPDTDTIRWVETRPSLRVQRDDGGLRIELLRFGRKIMPELAAAFGEAGGDQAYLLDLRQAQGGSFARMLEVAGFFLGPRRHALALVGAGGTTWLDLPAAGGARAAARGGADRRRHGQRRRGAGGAAGGAWRRRAVRAGAQRRRGHAQGGDPGRSRLAPPGRARPDRGPGGRSERRAAPAAAEPRR